MDKAGEKRGALGVIEVGDWKMARPVAEFGLPDDGVLGVVG